MRVNVIKQGISASLLGKRRKLKRIIPQATEYFKSVTPIRSGNARRNTKQYKEGINADYPYAKRLDNGWSRQAPRGMSEPTLKYIKKQVRSIFGR